MSCRIGIGPSLAATRARGRIEMPNENAVFGHTRVVKKSGMPPSRRRPPGLACPAQLTSDPARPTGQTLVGKGRREGSSSCQAASLLLVLSRIHGASVIRRHGCNQGQIDTGNRPAGDVANRMACQCLLRYFHKRVDVIGFDTPVEGQRRELGAAQ